MFRVPKSGAFVCSALQADYNLHYFLPYSTPMFICQTTCASLPRSGVDADMTAIRRRLEKIKHKILILSGKGGVGKSTFAAQLAFGLSARGMDVGLLDVDICGPSAPVLFGKEGHEVHRSNSGWSPVYVSDNLAVMSVGFLLNNSDDAVIWRGPRKSGLIKQFLKDTEWGPIDFLIVDTPPGTSDEHLSMVQYMKDTGVDGALIITTPQEVAMADVRKELNFCSKVGIPILGVVENMSGLSLPFGSDLVSFSSGADGSDITGAVRDVLAAHFMPAAPRNDADKNYIFPRLNIHVDVFPATRGGAAFMCEQAGANFLGRIPLDPSIAWASEHGRSLFHTQLETSATDANDEVNFSPTMTAVNMILNQTIELLETHNRCPQV